MARRLGLVRSPLERFYDQLDTEELQGQLINARDDAAIDVSPSLLLTVATLRTPQCRVAKDKRALAHRFHEPLLQKWLARNSDHRLAASAPHAIVILRTDEPDLRIALSPVGAPDFDWGPGRVLLNRVDTIVELAKSWLEASDERAPHIERAYGLATQVLGAVQRERWRRLDLGIAASAPPTENFTLELDDIRPQIERAEELFVRSARQNAEDLYVRGMTRGAFWLGLLCLAGGALLYAFELPAVTGIALPAGGLGAVISVLQRLTSGSLDLDYRAPSSRLRAFGRARPWIGGVFGMVLYALLQSHFLGITVNPPAGVGRELAFYGIIGFLAGFNERFAQDVVSGSAGRLGRAVGVAQAATPA